MEYIQKVPELNFKLGKLAVLNGNLVIKVEQGDVANISTLFMYNCKEENVQFDDLQSVHVTLFKTCSEKPECYEKYSSEEANDYWRKH